MQKPPGPNDLICTCRDEQFLRLCIASDQRGICRRYYVAEAINKDVLAGPFKKRRGAIAAARLIQSLGT